MKHTIRFWLVAFLLACLVFVLMLFWMKCLSAPIPTDNIQEVPTVPLETNEIVIETRELELDENLQQKLQMFCEKFDGKWDVWVESLSEHTMAQIKRNTGEAEPMISASLIKLFVMGAVYDAVESGTLSSRDVNQELHAMITNSDNQATNSLIRKLGNGNVDAGMDTVNAFSKKIGCLDSKLNRLMLAENALQNYTTAADCARILRLIYRGQCVSEQSSAEMLSLLIEQRVNNRIPCELPNGLTVAHKTGDLIGLCCADVGIVFAPSGDFILCAICNNPPSDARAASEIAELSAFAYDYYENITQDG